MGGSYSRNLRSLFEGESELFSGRRPEPSVLLSVVDYVFRGILDIFQTMPRPSASHLQQHVPGSSAGQLKKKHDQRSRRCGTRMSY